MALPTHNTTLPDFFQNGATAPVISSQDCVFIEPVKASARFRQFNHQQRTQNMKAVRSANEATNFSSFFARSRIWYWQPRSSMLAECLAPFFLILAHLCRYGTGRSLQTVKVQARPILRFHISPTCSFDQHTPPTRRGVEARFEPLGLLAVTKF